MIKSVRVRNGEKWYVEVRVVNFNLFRRIESSYKSQCVCFSVVVYSNFRGDNLGFRHKLKMENISLRGVFAGLGTRHVLRLVALPNSFHPLVRGLVNPVTFVVFLLPLAVLHFPSDVSELTFVGCFLSSSHPWFDPCTRALLFVQVHGHRFLSHAVRQ